MVGAPILALDFFLNGSAISVAGANFITALIVLLALFLFAWLYFTTRYAITSEALFVKSGPFTWVIPSREITGTEPNDGDLDLIVSPADKQGFVAAIKKHENREPG